MNKTNDVEKVRERERREEGELKAKMGQDVFLLYFHLGKASLRSLFPEHGGIYVCTHACACACTGVCMYVHRLTREIVSMHMHIHAYICACP